MKEHVTVIPEDKIIIVDSLPLQCEFDTHIAGLHALQWHNGKGELEIVTDGRIRNVESTSYTREVKPYVDIWQAKYDEINTPYIPTFEEQKAAKLGEVKMAFEEASANAHFMSSAGFEIDANETANRDINGLIVVLEANGGDNVQFRAYDNTFHTVTLDDLKQMRVDISLHGQNLYIKKWTFENAIDAATTETELNAITITFEGIDR